MDLTLTLTGLSIYILIWEKLPDWGTWFNTLVTHLPRPLAYLYQAWHCPYCFGFWVALLLQGATGLKTFPAFARMPDYLGPFGTPLGCFLDALATAMLIMSASLILKAIAGPAIRGHEMTMAFKEARKQRQDG